MRGKPTQQAQNAIDALLASGFKRNQFRVETEKLYFTYDEDAMSEFRGKRGYEYGSAKIYWRYSNIVTKDVFERTDAMLAAGLHVIHFYESDGRLATVLVDTEYAKRGKLDVYKLQECK